MRRSIQDLRYSVRTLLKQPGFSVIAIPTLALGIGANTAVFSLVTKVLFRQLPVREPEHIVEVTPLKIDPMTLGKAKPLTSDKFAFTQ